jgi:hypothetical protein
MWAKYQQAVPADFILYSAQPAETFPSDNFFVYKEAKKLKIKNM